MERKYLPEKLGDEEIVLKPSIPRKLWGWLSSFIFFGVFVSCLIAVINNDNLQFIWFLLAFTMMIVRFVFIFIFMSERVTREIYISKKGLYTSKFDRLFEWSEISYLVPYSIYDYVFNGDVLEGIKIVFKNNETEKTVISLNFYESPRHIALMLQNYLKQFEK